MLAARGARETQTGTEPVADDGLKSALRRRAIGVWVRTVAWTALTCGLALTFR